MPTPTASTQRAALPERPRFGGARALAPLALSAAAGLHLAQAVRHLPDGSFHGRLHAAFFVFAGILQILSVLAVRAGRHTSVIALGNVGLAAVWVLSVTVGLPIWLSPTSPEPLTLAGALAAGLAASAGLALVTAAVPAPSGGTTERVSTGAPSSAPTAAACLALLAGGWALPVSGNGHRHTDHHHAGAAHEHAIDGHGDHDVLRVEGVHLHGLGGDPFDPGPDPRRQARGPLAGTRLPVGARPAAVAVDGGVVWVADREAGVVHRLDERSGRPIAAPTPVGVHPGGVAVGAGGVWVTNAGSDTVSRLDPATGETLTTIAVGRVPVGVAVGDGWVWVANSAEGTVSRIDPATAEVFTTARIGYGPTAVTVAAGRLWVVTALDRAVVSLDPETGAVLSETPVDAGPAAIAFGQGSVWVASSSAGTVTRIDPLTGAPMGAPIVVDRQTQPGQGPAALAVGRRVSVLNNHDNTVVAIDPSNHAVSQPQFIDRGVARSITPAALALSNAGELWATEHESGSVVRLPA